MKASTEKRLFQYAWLFKKGIIIGIICLMIATAFELAGPLIAKRIIDEHILGVEGVWHEVTTEQDGKTVAYDGRFFVRENRLDNHESPIDQITILAIGKSYYLVDEVVPTMGSREVIGGTIKIGKTNPIEVEAEKLTLKNTYHFFELEKGPIFLLLGLYIVFLLVAGLFQFFQTYLLQRASNQIVKKMRNDVFQHTQRLPVNYYVDQAAGKIVARITNDTEAMRELYERVLSIVATQLIYMAGILIAIYILSPKMALIGLAIIPLIYIWMRIYKYFGSKYNLVIRWANSDINGNINEAIQGMPIIQAYGMEEGTKEDFDELNEEIYVHQKKLVRLGALTSFNLVNVLRNTTFVAFIWYFGNLSLEPTSIISIGMLYALVDYLTRFFEPVTDIVNQFPLIEQARAAGTRMFRLMDEAGEDVVQSTLKRYEGKVNFQDVTFSYIEGENVLQNISFDIEVGETAAFVGHTGSGKSTIMNLLFRFYDPQAGSISIDNKNIAILSRQEVRRHMGIVLQDPYLFSGTVLSNVTMDDPRISRENAIKALQAVGANTFIEKLPKNYDEIVTEGGATFSLGQRQLISFARALAFDPAILVLDEATANIDTETENMIQKALQVLQEGRTTLVIAHRLSTIQDAEKIFVLENGRIKEAGNHNELVKQEGIYYHMYQMQQKTIKHTG